MELYRIIYLSKMSVETQREDIIDLIDTSKKNNQNRGLTGMLMFSNKNFMQILEGDVLQLNRTFESIMQDNRHHEIYMLEYVRISRRLFGDWEMKLVSLDDYVIPRTIQLQVEGSLFAPFPRDKDLALELLLNIKHKIQPSFA